MPRKLPKNPFRTHVHVSLGIDDQQQALTNLNALHGWFDWDDDPPPDSLKNPTYELFRGHVMECFVRVYKDGSITFTPVVKRRTR